MIKIAITLEGSHQEMEAVLQFISNQQDEETEVHEEEATTPELALDEHFIWTERKIRAVYWGVSYNCRKLFRELAKNEEGLTALALSKKLGLGDERGIGGVLSSLGRQLNDSNYKDLPYPLDWTTYGRHIMIPIWRDMVTKLAEEQDSIVGDNE